MRVKWWAGGRKQLRAVAQPSLGLSWNDAGMDCAEFEIGPAAAALRHANVSQRAAAANQKRKCRKNP